MVSGVSGRIVLAALGGEAGPSFEVEELHEDGEHVVAIGWTEDGHRAARRWIVHDGSVNRDEWYSDPDEALRAAGLDESTGHDVALVRRHYAAFGDGNLVAMTATLHPEVQIFVNDERAGGQREEHRGREEALALFDEIWTLVDDHGVDLLSAKATPGRVQASIRLHGVVRATGRMGPLPAIHFFTVSDGLISRIETYRPDWRAPME